MLMGQDDAPVDAEEPLLGDEVHREVQALQGLAPLQVLDLDDVVHRDVKVLELLLRESCKRVA